tara:strand:+ start:340 stop:1719 length:1380 start_codon:yes stop_codon:yes gene_type:complete
MATLAIDINDASLVVAHEGEVLAREPGYALVEDGRIVTGTEALRQARVKPSQVSSRYWTNLSVGSNTAGVEGVDSASELAHAQLKTLWTQIADKSDDVVLIVPNHYTREQLGVLLGLTQEIGIRVSGMLSSAAAVSARPYPGRQLVHLDVGLHRVSVTPLEQSDSVMALQEIGLEDTGLTSVMDLWAQRFSELFVLATRFDPLHRADTEQLIYDYLPGWLQSIQEKDVCEFELEHYQDIHRIEVRREQLLAAASGFYRALVQLVAQVRQGGASLVVQVSHHLGLLPGLMTELQRLDDALVLSLGPDAPVMGALAMPAVESKSGQVKLLKRVPWREQAQVAVDKNVFQNSEKTPDAGSSHVVYKGIAYPVGAEGLSIGRTKDKERRSIVLEGGHSGVSSSHCELVLRDGEVKLIDRSRHGTFVNEKRVPVETTLRPADVIRIGSPGEELWIISVGKDCGS